MAEFTGTGAVIFAGGNQKVWNIEFNNDGGVELNGVNQFEMFSCVLSVPVTATADNDALDIHDNIHTSLGVFFDGGGFGNDQSDIHDNVAYATAGGIVNVQAEQIKIRGNTIVCRGQGIELVVTSAGYDVIVTDNTCDGGNIYVEGTDFDLLYGGVIVANNSVIPLSTTHGIHLKNCKRTSIHHNHVSSEYNAEDNTHDGIFLEGDSDDNHIEANYIHGNNILRYGINVSAATCNDNIVVGNVYGAVADYMTGPFNDAGTGTRITYPAHATYGDNFTR